MNKLRNRSDTPDLRPGMFLAALWVASTLSGCATLSASGKAQHPTEPSSRSALPPRETPANEASELRDIQTLYVRGAHEAALLRLDGFESRYPKSAYLGYADNLRGLVFLVKKDPASAAKFFNRALARSGSAAAGFENYVLYNLASAQIELKDIAGAVKTLDRIRPELLDTDNRYKYHHLKAQLNLKRELHFEAARELLAASRFLSNEQLAALRDDRTGITASLTEALAKVTNTMALDQLYRESQDSVLADEVLVELISKELAEGNNGKAEEYFNLLSQKHPDSTLRPRASELVSRSRQLAAPDLQAVGVLLPMTGKFARFGERTLRAIQLAFRVFNEREPDSKLALVIEDSGEEPEQAIAALNRLVLEHRVVAVLGPMLSKGIDQVTQRADDLGIPMISLARYGESRDHVISGGLTMRQQARDVARFAIQKMKLRKFAILTPQDKIGQEASQHFWDAVEEFGGEVTGYETYPVGETDFRQSVDKLSGLFYTEARHRELAELAKLREENKITKRNRKTEQYFALTPIIDYEAIFIPDEPGVSGQILPTFAYRDVDQVFFLGTSAWNSIELPRRAQNEASKAIFVDAYYAGSQAANTVRFVDRYRATFEQEPTALDAIAYDAARILEQALSQGPSSRPDVLRLLRSTQNFPGATGTIRYEDGTLPRTVHFLTFSGQNIVPAQENAR